MQVPSSEKASSTAGVGHGDDEVIPSGLTSLEYARYIIENKLAWPVKSNLELIADCITGVMKTKRLTGDKACKYMMRAIKLAHNQGIVVDRLFFLNGQYATVRPRPTEPKNEWAKWKAEQKKAAEEGKLATQEQRDEMSAALKKLAASTTFPKTPFTKLPTPTTAELAEQIASNRKALEAAGVKVRV